MKQKKKFISKQLIAFSLSAAILSGTAGFPASHMTTSQGKTLKILIIQKELSMKTGQTKTLVIKNKKGKVTWTSSKKSIATVSKTGKVKAKKKGKTVIKAVMATKTKKTIYKYSLSVKAKTPKSDPISQLPAEQTENPVFTQAPVPGATQTPLPSPSADVSRPQPASATPDVMASAEPDGPLESMAPQSSAAPRTTPTARPRTTPSPTPRTTPSPTPVITPSPAPQSTMAADYDFSSDTNEPFSEEPAPTMPPESAYEGAGLYDTSGALLKSWKQMVSAGWITEENYYILKKADSSRMNGSLVLPDAIERIDDAAFENCSSLTGVTISEKTYVIGNNAFLNCTGLTSITVPSSVIQIGWSAFEGCSGLQNVTLSEGLKKISQNAFKDCQSLQGITIPASVTDIYTGTLFGNPFAGCTSLKTIRVADGNKSYDSRNGCNAIIDKLLNTLLVGCKNTTIPLDISGIGGYAFEGCSGLYDISIPENINYINDYAFSGCTSLTAVSIPSSVVQIGWGIFYQCSGLKEIYYSGSAVPLSWGVNDISVINR